MKTILSLITLLATLSLAQAAQTVVVPLAANTVSNILATPKLIDGITLTAGTTNTTTVYFYDAATATTSMVQAAYTRFESYATNYTITFTNQSGIIVSNTFAGIYTAPIATLIATNERPKMLSIVVPGSAQVALSDLQLQSLQGLTAVPTHAVVATVLFRNVQ